MSKNPSNGRASILRMCEESRQRMNNATPAERARLEKEGRRMIAEGARLPAGCEPSAVSDPIGWRTWWMRGHRGKTFADASAAWKIAVS